MSRTQEPHRPFLCFGNPFRMISQKGSHLSPNLLPLLHHFEETLAGRVAKLKPASKADLLHLLWMRRAVESLCEIHTDAKTLITVLELPICNWEDAWVDVFLDSSIKLLDVSTAFASEVSRLKHGNMYIQCAASNLSDDGFNAKTEPFPWARSTIDGWKKHTCAKNPRLDKCFSTIDEFARKLDLPEIKNPGKSRTKIEVLMRAMYGVRAATLLICSIIAAVFSGSPSKVTEVKVDEVFLWRGAFVDLQGFVSNEIRSFCSNEESVMVIKEVDDVDYGVNEFCQIAVQGGDVAVNRFHNERFRGLMLDLKESGKNLGVQLDMLGDELDRFFGIVLTGRDALLSNLRVGSDAFDCRRDSGGKAGGLVIG